MRFRALDWKWRRNWNSVAGCRDQALPCLYGRGPDKRLLKRPRSVRSSYECLCQSRFRALFRKCRINQVCKCRDQAPPFLPGITLFCYAFQILPSSEGLGVGSRCPIACLPTGARSKDLVMRATPTSVSRQISFFPSFPKTSPKTEMPTMQFA